MSIGGEKECWELPQIRPAKKIPGCNILATQLYISGLNLGKSEKKKSAFIGGPDNKTLGISTFSPNKSTSQVNNQYSNLADKALYPPRSLIFNPISIKASTKPTVSHVVM